MCPLGQRESGGTVAPAAAAFPPHEDSAELMQLAPALEFAAGPGEWLLPTLALCSQFPVCLNVLGRDVGETRVGSGCGVRVPCRDEPSRWAASLSQCAWTLSCPSSGLCSHQGVACFGFCPVTEEPQ